MVWVLWDILIPLMASFALGTLLGWLVWSWRRRNNAADEAATTAEFVDEHANSGETGSDSGSIVMLEQENAAYKEMEKANVVLITERDEATQAFENLQLELQEMQEKIVELETETETEELNREESSANESLSIADNASNGLPLTVGLGRETKDNEELELLKSDFLQLTGTLDKERKARRATELELLNIKNRHDKLSADLAATVSVVEHDSQISERDEEIESLRQQLAIQAQLQEESVIEELLKPVAPVIEAVEKTTDETDQVEVKDEEELATHEASEPAEPAVEVEPGHDTSISVAAAAGVDFLETDIPVESKSVVVENKKPNKSGYTPAGWTVPDKKPPKTERDSLTDIKGVGPVLEKILHDCGIYYFRQVANLDKSGMDELQQQIPQFPGRIKRDKWVKQAKTLQRKKYGESA